jgi:hypothetical protein
MYWNWIEMSCNQPNSSTIKPTRQHCLAATLRAHRTTNLHIENYLKKQTNIFCFQRYGSSFEPEDIHQIGWIICKVYTCTVPEWQIHQRKHFLLVTNGAHSSGSRGGHQDVAKLLSFVLSNTVQDQVFSIMNCYWRNEHRTA